MKVYIDVVLFINIFFDFILLLSVSIILKRHVKLYRIVLGSVVGGLSILFLFFNISTITLFFLKIIIAILMVISSFSYRNIKYTLKNLSFLYLVSIALGGMLYLFNIEFSYKNTGIIFYNSGYSVNIIIILIVTPILLYIYINELKDLKNNYSKYYKTIIYFKGNDIVELNSYFDTGNNLKDPYMNRIVILVNEDKVKKYIDKVLYIPYSGVENGLLRCIRSDKVIINNIEYKNVLLGLINNICIDGVDIILNNRMEDICLEN